MRWFVEVSPLGKSEAPSEQHCVEAAQWQQALAQVRKHAGHDETLRNFSIEVLDDGVRAVDPIVRLRYLMKRAPADERVTLGQERAEAAPTTAKAVPSSTPAPSPPAPAPAAGARRSFAQTMVFGSSGGASFQQTLASAGKRPSSPGAQPDEPPAPPSSAVAQAQAPDASVKIVERPVAAPAPPRSEPPRPAMPSYRVLMQRQQAPTAASPITYREMAFALLQDADELSAEKFIRGRFEDIRAELESSPPGKLVNLAVFDHVFDKKPQRPPVVTLVWKDWKTAEPELRFPMRPGTSLPPPSLGAPSQPASQPPSAPPKPVVADTPTPASTPIAIRRESSQQPPAPVQPTPPAAGQPPPPAAVQPSPPAAVQPPPPAAVQPPPPAAGQPPPPAAVQPPPPAAGQPPPPAAGQPPPPRKSAPPRPPRSVSPSPVQAQPEAPAPTTARLGSAPPPRMASEPPKASAASGRTRKATPGPIDIVADLFEVMHDLNFLRDVQAGAEFVMGLAREKLQSPYALVQLYDINRREFVVACAAGPNAQATVGGRTSERDPLLVEIMQRRTPFVIDASLDPRVRTGRWTALGVQPSRVLAASVAQGGRFLGVIEVGCAPGSTYVKQHLDGMAYIADAFSEFLAARGIVFSSDVSPGH